MEGATDQPDAEREREAPETAAETDTSPAETVALADAYEDVEAPTVAHATAVYSPHSPRSCTTAAVQDQEPPLDFAWYHLLAPEGAFTSKATLEGATDQPDAERERAPPETDAETETSPAWAEAVAEPHASVTGPKVAQP